LKNKERLSKERDTSNSNFGVIL